MTQDNYAQFGGVEFWTLKSAPLDQINRIIAASLFDYGHHVERQSAISSTRSRITTSACRVEISLTPMPRPDDLQDDEHVPLDALFKHLEIVLSPLPGTLVDADHMQLLLVVTLYRLVEALDARRVQWLDPDVVLTARQFCSAFSDVTPPRSAGSTLPAMEKAARFGSVDDSQPMLDLQYEAIRARGKEGIAAGLIKVDHETALMNAFRHDPLWMQAGLPDEVKPAKPASTAERLTVWAMTLMMIFIAAPVAAAMAAVNLMRGEDLRLNTHLMGYAALILAAQQTEVFVQVARVLGA
ncbi:MAG: hypothetical protein HRU31_07810 [Rhodobacteraceae bacterium]|nr:hypothetical protein [Paracoccaceae bacterium]